MVRPIASVVLALCFVPALLLAQSDTATVSGLVTDSKDAVLVGAQVRAINVEAGTSSTALTNRDGVYVLRDLRPGQYRLIVDNEGFQQIVLVGLTLSAQDAVGRNFTMQIGSIIQSVTLTASGREGEHLSRRGHFGKPTIRAEPAAQRPQLPITHRPYPWRRLRAPKRCGLR